MRSVFPLPCCTEARARVSPASSTEHRQPGTRDMLGQQLLDLRANITASWNAGELGSPLAFQEAPWGRPTLLRHSPIRQDALGDFTHQDKEQHEGQDPAQVVPGEVEPRAVVNVHLGALAAPSCNETQEEGDAWLSRKGCMNPRRVLRYRVHRGECSHLYACA